jgi:hypothetical protein
VEQNNIRFLSWTKLEGVNTFAMDVGRGFVVFYVGHGRGRCPMQMPNPYGPC